MKKKENLIVITGCDSGIGKDLAFASAKAGYAVLVSYLEENPFNGAPGITAVKMDLRDEEQIAVFFAACRDMLESGYRLHALVSNAGIALGGPVEDIPLSLFRSVMEVNFFGLVSLVQKMIPCLARDRALCVIHGSMAGRIALPFLAPYASSKFALEGFADSLRRELSPFGVKTVLLETAGIATPIWKKAHSLDMAPYRKEYHRSLELFMTRFVDAGNSGLACETAARRILKIIEKKNPRGRYVVGSSVLLSKIEMRLPRRLMDYALKKLFSMEYRRR